MKMTDDRFLCLTETYVEMLGSLNMSLHMMPLAKIQVNVMTSKIHPGDDSVVPAFPTVKTRGELCEVQGNKGRMEKLQTEIHPETIE